VSLTLLQRGLTGAVVVIFFPSPIGALRTKIVRALGPMPTIIITETAKGSETIADIMGFAAVHTGREDVFLACLAGFSAGCQRVRALRIAGVEASAYLFIDGAHASNPPAPWQIEYLTDLVERARQQEITLVISHTYVVTEPSYLSTAAVARLATGWALPKPTPGRYNTRFERNLTVYSVYSEDVDVVAHSAQAYVWLPILLDGHVRPIVEPGYESGTVPVPAGQVPRRVFTVDGWMDLEREYVPRVVTRENGAAAPEALKAQAVAARTYVLRAMRDNATLGTPARPIPNSQSFQTYAPAATPTCMAAVKATARIVALYQNELIFANYVAGAIWSNDGVPSSDPTKTEKWVTYNEGKHGEHVTPTKLSSVHKANRGCMSQNGAHWLALHGYAYNQILGFFYGADLELRELRAGPSQPAPSGKGDGALLFLAGAALLMSAGRRLI